jgi:ribosome-associated toxin RatA of RatAB toxin-antitoxin module
MSTTITSGRDIEASVEQLWALTVDVERWPELSPTTMTSIERLDTGPMRVGSRARVVQPRQRPKIWTVTELVEHDTFAWQARVFGVAMTGRHHVVDLGDGRCRNELRLELAGFGAGLLGLVLGRTFQQVIDTENEGFRREAERLAAGA